LILVLLGGLLLAAGGTWAVLEFIVWNKLPRALVGTWAVVEGEMEGAVYEFRRDGSMTARGNVGPQPSILSGRAEVEDRILYVTTQDPLSGEDVQLTHTIHELSARQLVLETEEGALIKMKRVQE
jgi:hypothetical protein